MEIESVFKNLPTKKNLGLDGFTFNSTKYSNKESFESNQFLSNSSKKFKLV